LVAAITLDRLTKVFDDGTVGVDDVSLHVDHGEFVVFVGPSGGGKSTALRLIAGLEEVTSGTVALDGRVVNDVEAADRDVAMVFQNYALYPHMTVAENIGFSLRTRELTTEEIARRVAEAAKLLGVDNLLDRKPATLSAGQRQRAAIGRAIVRQPQAFLLDEPFSNLDAKLRGVLRGELIRIHQRFGTTTIYVTHDQIEAMSLGDRIVALNRGRVQQVGSPEELFFAPGNLFVAGFVGSPAMNFAHARLTGSAADRDLVLEVGPFRWALPPEQLLRRPALAEYVGREVIIGLRPSDFAWTPEWRGPDMPAIVVDVIGAELLGAEKHIVFAMPTPEVKHPDFDYPAGGNAARDDRADGDDEEDLTLFRPEDGASVWTARVGPWARVFGGDFGELTVDLDKAYFFDLDTGQAVHHPTMRPVEVACSR
jgi:multiple sugar transport system ATP-binding protein